MTISTPGPAAELGRFANSGIPAREMTGGVPSALELCFRRAFATSPVPMLVMKRGGGRIVAANSAAGDLFGVAPARLESSLMSELLACEEEELRSAASDSRTVTTTIRAPHVSGSTVHFTTLSFGQSGDELLLLEFLSSPGNRIGDTARDNADPLTGLANRNEFDRRLASDIQRVSRDGRPLFALLFIDLDDFKPVNDRLGHAVGDRVLAAVARRLAAGIRPGDLLSRRGGDEFTLLVESVADANEARRIAERLRARAMEPFELDGHYLHVGASIGIVLGDGSIGSPEAMIEAADRAMYAAKRLGHPVVHSAP